MKPNETIALILVLILVGIGLCWLLFRIKIVPPITTPANTSRDERSTNSEPPLRAPTPPPYISPVDPRAGAERIVPVEPPERTEEAARVYIERRVEDEYRSATAQGAGQDQARRGPYHYRETHNSGVHHDTTDIVVRIGSTR